MTNGDRIIIPRANPINSYTMPGIIKDAGLTIPEFKELIKAAIALFPNQNLRICPSVG